MRKFAKPRSTQRSSARTSGGHVPNSPAPHDPHVAGAPPGRLKPDPSADNYPVHLGPRIDRIGEENKQLTNITNERARPHPHSLAKRFTKFITNFRGQVRIPANVIGQDRPTSGDEGQFSQRKLEVGQVPED